MKVSRGRLESGPKITVNYLLYMSSNADEPWKNTRRFLHPTSFFYIKSYRNAWVLIEMTYLISHPAKKIMSLFSVHPEEQKQACVCFCECRPTLETWNCISEPYVPVSSSHLLYTSLSSFIILILSCTLHYSCSSRRWKDMSKQCAKK